MSNISVELKEWVKINNALAWVSGFLFFVSMLALWIHTRDFVALFISFIGALHIELPTKWIRELQPKKEQEQQ